MSYYNYHAQLHHLLKTEPYFIRPADLPFAYRFVFPTLGKSMPIRAYRIKEYQEYLEVK